MRSSTSHSLSILGLAILLSSSLQLAIGGTIAEGGSCSQSNNRVDQLTGAFNSDCDARTFCDVTGICQNRTCRSDMYPYGFNGVDYTKLPALCPDGQFCPDEGDACQAQIAVGGTCQLDRDDECAPPTNYKDLAGPLNTNGTICLSNICYYANVTLGQTCIIENQAFNSYTEGGYAVAIVVSRDNCANNLYCDGSALKCLRQVAIGGACTANKECLTYNCSPTTKLCLKGTDAPDRPPNWVYAVVATCVAGLIVGILLGLFFIHRKDRRENQIKLEQYYTEQMAYRKSIMSLQHARASLFNMPKDATQDDARQSLISDDASLIMGSNGLYQRAGSPNSSPFHDKNRRESNFSRGGSEGAESHDGLIQSSNTNFTPTRQRTVRNLI